MKSTRGIPLSCAALPSETRPSRYSVIARARRSRSSSSGDSPRAFVGIHFSVRLEARNRRWRAVLSMARTFTITCLVLAPVTANAQPAPQDEHPDIRLFLEAGVPGPQSGDALRQIEAQWRDAYAGMVWDLAWMLRPPGQGFVHFFSLIGFLQELTGQPFGGDLAAWQRWIWSQPYDPHPDHAFFKGQWYSQIDPRFADFFPRGVTSRIRLDEIEWGGVGVNGIPPLDYPPTLAARDAAYLADDHVVFGIALNGEARAYPKRILAWHEMALDRVGGIELTIVYCTLCGTVIPFESVAGGRHLTFGTSGLLYRSNKLMFDHETRSLWNTFEGIPVIGELADGDLRLTPHAVVTTTWGEWRRRHPDTTVLSLDTGHRRNYAEGVAYRSYFGTDDLMFAVSRTDARLANKEEVLVLRRPDPAGDGAPTALAITARFLARNRVFHHDFAGLNLVVATSEQGANRAYDAGDVRFVRHLDEERVADDTGRAWRITEAALVLDADSSVRRMRLPAQRAFWFGWYAQFPDTALID